MQFFGDYHTHSRFSDGRQSVGDIINAARARGLKEIAITDHGPLVAVIGVRDVSDYLKIKAELATHPESEGIRLLIGAEANIRDMHGTLDIPREIIEKLDLLIAGLHPYTLPTSLEDGMGVFVQNSLRHLGRYQRDKAIEHNTLAVLAAIDQNPDLDIISHPGLFFALDIYEVGRACARNDVLFEINCGHNFPDLSAIMEADRAGASFIINSDAHFEDSVGSLAYGEYVIETLGIDKDRVANYPGRGGYDTWGKRAKH
ncbi:MAG: PHP domain-containing protein [Syntrophomonadaceae bacterium]|nr:PHP domain-containing protein [Syntrophomonadaceae bacterium]